MMQSFDPLTIVHDLTIDAIPADGILSRTLYNDDQIKVVLFGFAAAQELSEHTAAMPAIIQIVSGGVQLTLGSTTLDAQPGTWVHLPARMPHSLVATTPAIMLLTLLKPPRTS